MKLLLCFALGSLAFLVTNSKKIKIQIESEDLINIFEGVMYSEVMQKLAMQLVQRSSKDSTLDNPYHPEDELLNSFKTDVDKKIEYASSSPKSVVTTDALDEQNDQFLNGNDVDDDILTDAEDMKSISKLVEKHNLWKMSLNSTNENIEMKKNIDNAVNNNNLSSKKGMNISDDMNRLSFKKGINISDDMNSLSSKKGINISDDMNSLSSKKGMNISDHTKIFDDDRAYFKPVQRRFVLKGSNDTPTNTLII